MTFSIHDWFVLRRLERERAACNRLFLKEIEDAKKGQDYEEAARLESDGSSQNEMYCDFINAEVTKQLTETARRLQLPVPATNDRKYWRSHEETGLCLSILNCDGICYLRDAIRDERKKRREVWFAWLDAIGKILTVIIGLVGAAIGLVSVLLK